MEMIEKTNETDWLNAQIQNWRWMTTQFLPSITIDIWFSSSGPNLNIVFRCATACGRSSSRRKEDFSSKKPLGTCWSPISTALCISISISISKCSTRSWMKKTSIQWIYTWEFDYREIITFSRKQVYAWRDLVATLAQRYISTCWLVWHALLFSCILHQPFLVAIIHYHVYAG